MPDLSNLIDSSPMSLVLSTCPTLESQEVKPIDDEEEGEKRFDCSWDLRLRHQKIETEVKVLRKRDRKKCRKPSIGKSFEDHVKDWVDKKMELGVSERDCFLPFLVNARRAAECRICSKFILSGEEVVCRVHGCGGVYHITCAKKKLGLSSSRSFKCPQHVCFICKQNRSWRCTRCTMASHKKCAPWPWQEKVTPLANQPGRVCWKHPTDWRWEKKHAVTGDIEEIFCRLPVPYNNEEFKIDLMLKGIVENEMEPTPFVHIRRNVYLVKKKRNDADADNGCSNCDSATCSEDCVCRGQYISCSKACHCSGMCTNRPFRKEKKVKLVKTHGCGWGVVAAESIKNEEFVVEYIGEVIDDALCEQRLWDMKYRGDQNFYMCEIRKDFTIDATFKGNSSRFLNHSCDPNCKLEKWQVDGETRVGVFAARSINIGEPLTYDYRFVHFGPKVKCCCGTAKCQGYLGPEKRKTGINMDLFWGSKRRRTTTLFLNNVYLINQ